MDEWILCFSFEIAPPSATDEVCGIATLTPLDMATSKLLVSSDRWNDDGVFSRDLIDLAMMIRMQAADGLEGQGIEAPGAEKSSLRYWLQHFWAGRSVSDGLQRFDAKSGAVEEKSLKPLPFNGFSAARCGRLSF